MGEIMNDDIGNSNFTWTNASTTTGNFTIATDTNAFTFSVNGTSYEPVIPDKNWMPYRYVEYEPRWHQKFARYKLQIKKMWD